MNMTAKTMLAVAVSATGMLFAGTTPSQTEQDGPGAGWRLKWSDEFNGTQLDTNVWRQMGRQGGCRHPACRNVHRLYPHLREGALTT